MNWSKVELNDVLEKIVGGGTPSKSISDYWNGDIPWCSVKDMVGDKYQLYSTEDTITNSGLENSSSNLIPSGTVITSTRMGLGRAFINKVDMAINQDLKALIPNERIDNKFLLWTIVNKSEEIEGLGIGSTVKGIRLEVLKGLKFNLPPLLTQRKIASILSAYDDLIENNLKRIILLEEKARIEYILIQKNKKIEFKKAHEVLQFSTGKLNSNAAVENGLYPFFTCGQEILRTNTFSLDEEVVLLGGNNANAIYPVFYYNGKFDAYQRTYIIKPKPEVYISFKYLYFFWESKLDYLRNISTGAATKFLTLKILNDIDLPMPSKKVMEEYETLTEPIFKLKAVLTDQNTKLREARDILLPKLMNGQIEV